MSRTSLRRPAATTPPSERVGWKDTVYLRPNTGYRLVMTFTDYTDDHTWRCDNTRRDR